jgi:hypothetical protein
MVKIIIITLAAAAVAYASSGILFVADNVEGVSDPQHFEQYYRDAFEHSDNNFNYTYWDYATMGTPGYDDMLPYRIVMWYLGASGEYPASHPVYGKLTISEAEQATLIDYLDNAPGERSVAVIGMYAAWNSIADDDNEEQYPNTFFDNYLKLDYPDDNFDNWIEITDDWEAKGVGGDPITNGATYPLNWRHTKNYPDQLEPASKVTGSAKWMDTYQNPHHYCILRNTGSGYKTVLMSLPFECIEEETNRTEFMGNLVDWLGYGTSDIKSASLGEIKASFR